jgi:hypothetical protein
MVQSIGNYRVELQDTLVTIKDNKGNLLKAQVVDAWNAVERWNEIADKVRALVSKQAKGQTA